MANPVKNIPLPDCRPLVSLTSLRQPQRTIQKITQQFPPSPTRKKRQLSREIHRLIEQLIFWPSIAHTGTVCSNPMK